MSVTHLAAKIADRHIEARSHFNDLPLATVEAKVLDHVQYLRDEVTLLEGQRRRVEQAWQARDFPTLVREDALTKADLKHLEEAYEAQQEGDGEEMDKHLSKIAGADRMLDYILPTDSLFKLIQSLKKAGDDQSAALAREVFGELDARLRLRAPEQEALNRMVGSVSAIGKWDAATQRNNIFKAANLLGIKLPSSSF